MKCAVMASFKGLEITEREETLCGHNDVIVAVKVCGVCRTDRKMFNMGHRDLILPRVLGHEIVGIVKEIGANVTGFQYGDRVQISPGVFCSSCEYCISGVDHLCDKMRIIGFHLDGGFTELLRVPIISNSTPILNKIPSSLDYESACLTEPLACSINMQKRMDLGTAESMVIFGGGPLGVLNVQLARFLGVRRIAVVEPMESRRKFISHLSDCSFDFDYKTTQNLLEFSKGRGVDAVISCCSSSSAFQMGLEIAAKRSRIGFFSGITDNVDIPNSALNIIHYKELYVIGSYGCSLSDNKEALALLATERISTMGAPSLNISWRELPENLTRLYPQESVFTFFNS